MYPYSRAPRRPESALIPIQFGRMHPIILQRPLTAPQPRPYPPQGPGSYMQNGSGPVPGARPLLPDNGRVIQSGPTRVLCIADVRGKIATMRPLQAKLTRSR